MAIAAPRGGAHGNEDCARPGDACGQIGGERQPPGFGIAADQLFQPRLVDRHFAGLEPGDLAGILVDADDIMAEIGKAGARYQPDIARAHHRNLH